MKNLIFSSATFFCIILLIIPSLLAQKSSNPELDAKVKAFLQAHAGNWHDMNVPSSDGQLLHDIILKNNYTRALEIGTSTGHSAIWMAWALSKTGGKLITIDIDKERHDIAVANFKEAGLSEYIDARLADAHDLVKELPGPFDFAFSDADKEWYTQYFLDVNPKLVVGGCFTAHNISARGGMRGTGEFFEHIKKMPNYETTLDSRGGGVSISYKKAEK